MDQVQIKITAPQVITARYGTLSNGDVLRTDAAFARHLVEDCAAAKYLDGSAVTSAVTSASSTATTRSKRRTKKETAE